MKIKVEVMETMYGAQKVKYSRVEISENKGGRVKRKVWGSKVVIIELKYSIDRTGSIPGPLSDTY